MKLLNLILSRRDKTHVILRWLTPDDFTRQGESAHRRRVKPMNFLYSKHHVHSTKGHKNSIHHHFSNSLSFCFCSYFLIPHWNQLVHFWLRTSLGTCDECFNNLTEKWNNLKILHVSLQYLLEVTYIYMHNFTLHTYICIMYMFNLQTYVSLYYSSLVQLGTNLDW